MIPDQLAPAATIRDGQYHGRPTRIVETAHCWLEVLSGAGPRVVRFGLAGGPNVFAETPDIQWETAYGIYELLGGHRLWFAPERPDLNAPDGAGLVVEESIGAGGRLVLRMAGPVEPYSGLRRSMEIVPEPAAAAVSIRHGLLNDGPRSLELAAWPITQVPLGGVAIVPQPHRETGHGVLPNRLTVLWAYADWTDERLMLRDGVLAVHARSGRPFKVGCRSVSGALAYLRDGTLFVKRFDPALGETHPDLGCNVELYSDERSCELESVGPLVRLDPGCEVTFEERWQLHAVAQPSDIRDHRALSAVLEGLGLDEPLGTFADPMPTHPRGGTRRLSRPRLVQTGEADRTGAERR